jgi:hypothetical protein
MIEKINDRNVADDLVMVWRTDSHFKMFQLHYRFKDSCELEDDLSTEQPGTLEVEDDMRLTEEFVSSD